MHRSDVFLASAKQMADGKNHGVSRLVHKCRPSVNRHRNCWQKTSVLTNLLCRSISPATLSRVKLNA
jgi:hypothetical protein